MRIVGTTVAQAFVAMWPGNTFLYGNMITKIASPMHFFASSFLTLCSCVVIQKQTLMSGGTFALDQFPT